MAAVRAVTAHTGPGGLAGLVNDTGTDGFAPQPESASPASSPSSGRSCRCCARPRAGSCSSASRRRYAPPFAGPLAAMSATLRGELAPWHIDVMLTEPGPLPVPSLAP